MEKGNPGRGKLLMSYLGCRRMVGGTLLFTPFFLSFPCRLRRILLIPGGPGNWIKGGARQVG